MTFNLDDYVFDVDPEEPWEPKLRKDEPSSEADQVDEPTVEQAMRAIFDHDAETAKLVEQLRDRRAETRRALEQRAADAMAREAEAKETDHVDQDQD